MHAFVDRRGDIERRTRGCQSRHGREPADDAEYIEAEDCPVVVGNTPVRDSLGRDIVDSNGDGRKALHVWNQRRLCAEGLEGWHEQLTMKSAKPQACEKACQFCMSRGESCKGRSIRIIQANRGHMRICPG